MCAESLLSAHTDGIVERHSSVWPLFESMAEAGIQARVISEARAAIAGLPKTLAQLKHCSLTAFKNAQVPLAVRVWLRARGYASLEGCRDGRYASTRRSSSPARLASRRRRSRKVSAGRRKRSGGRGVQLGGAASAFSPR